MAGVKDHTELDAWKLSDQVRNVVEGLIHKPGFRDRPKLREQLSGAAESACPNIAEGFSRFFRRDFARFLRIAAGSLTEVIEHAYRARVLKVITNDEFDALSSLACRALGCNDSIDRVLGNSESTATAETLFSAEAPRRTSEPMNPEPLNQNPGTSEPSNPEPRHPGTQNH